MDRRTQLDDKKAELEHQCFNLFPERWGSLYREQMLPGVGNPSVSVSSEADEIPVTDPADLDAWYENLERQRRISGAEAAGAAGGLDHILGLADGEGVLV